MTTQTVSVPDIGGTEGAEIIEISVAVGDSVEKEQDIIVLETDKASMEIPCPVEGKVVGLSVKVGDKVSEGDALIEVDVAGEAAAASSSEKETKAEAPATEKVVAPASTSSEEVSVVIPEGADGAEVIEICVAVGDEVVEGDSLIVLETDKASMEVPAPQSGKVVSISIKQGDKTVEGADILRLAVEGAAPSEVVSAPAETASAPSATPAASANETITVPDGAEDAEVIEICVAVGDEVAEGDSLVVLETDKASMEVPSPKAGKVVSISIQQGDKTAVGGELVVLSVEGAVPMSMPAASVSPSAPAQATPVAATAKAPAASTAKPDEAAVISASQSLDVYAGPAVRKFAREMAVDLTQVNGTGERSRVTKDDVKTYVKQVMTGQKVSPAAAASGATGGSGIPAIPAVDFSQFGDIEMLPMSKIKKLTAANMQRNWLNIPHVTQFDDADITDLEDFRKGLKAEAEKRGVKLTPLPFLLKACAAALVAEPSFNVSMHHDGEHIVQKKYVNIGVAVDSPIGLVVPVIRDVDKKGLWELAEEFMQIIDKARNGKLGPKDMQGGCFTISSLGAMGGQGFTPIVNAPEVAILGVSKAEIKPKWNGNEFVPRNMLPLCLSYDHRAINGGDAGRFFTYLNSVIADVRRLLL
ncbi:Dihydrolipoamide acetyltransferase component of pyruvate dehydrogenase complex [gamma proteobacterium IMCC1989]|nr:Dihydrolipoamide acetyltransferase component of pyruvate dehydrogenase complex [gamma proteobacterium IMCC1989]